MTEEQKNIDFAECLGSILEDAASAYPADHEELFRDSKRITLQSRSRGLPFFTIDLPEVGKRFDASLSSGRLNLANLPHTRGKKRGSIIPKLFLGLWKRIFDQDGLLLDDADPSAIFFLRQLFYVAKKVELECSPKYLFDTTREFFHVEANLPSVDPFWDDNSPIHRSVLGDLSDRQVRRDVCEPVIPGLDDTGTIVPSQLLETCQKVSDRIASSFGLIHPEDLIPRHGPGVVSDRKGKKFDKYEFLYWSDSLQDLFPFDMFGQLNMSENLTDSLPTGYPIFRDWHSKLVAVPKTQKGPRLIAAEPHSNQWIQQSIARWIRWKSADTLTGVMVDFFDQEPSRVAAVEASRTGLRSTIDLKSASDRLTPWLIQRVFRSNPGLVDMFRACRTKYMLNPLDKKYPTLTKLKKFATQGSALTFPLQSIVFSTLCLGVAKHLNPRRGLRSLAREIRVFGDDLIVPSSWVPTVKLLLEALWLKVNTTKTHSVGKFRESCGMDAFRGYDVTPAYVTSLQTKALDARLLQGAIDIQNHFYLKGLWHAASHLHQTVPQVRKFPVVSPEARVPGLITLSKKGSYYVETNNLGRKLRSRDIGSSRFSQTLQRVEVRLPIFRERGLSVLCNLPSAFRPLHEAEQRDLLYSRAEGGNILSGPLSEFILQSYEFAADEFRFRHPCLEETDGSQNQVLGKAAGIVTNRWVPEWDAGEAFHFGRRVA
jgi:hypothetical protein